MSTLVMCPTRDREAEAQRLAKNILEESEATVAFYVDADQKGRYERVFRPFEGHPRLIVEYRPPAQPGPAANWLSHTYRHGHDLYGLMCDDMVVTTPGWDRWAEGVLFSGGVGVISPTHNFGNHVDIPFVTRNWIDAVGWFAHPAMNHYAWPTVIALLGEASQSIVHAPKEAFCIQHDQLSKTKSGIEQDAMALYEYLLYGFYDTVEKIKEAQGSAALPV